MRTESSMRWPRRANTWLESCGDGIGFFGSFAATSFPRWQCGRIREVPQPDRWRSCWKNISQDKGRVHISSPCHVKLSCQADETLTNIPPPCRKHPEKSPGRNVGKMWWNTGQKKCSACWNRDGDYDSSEYHIIRKYHLIPKFHETFLIYFLFFMKLSYTYR